MEHPVSKPSRIRLNGVRQNNLKNISVEFPLKKLTVVTGLSGSGKSSLAFETLYSEGQRRYIQSLSTYTRQFLDRIEKPDLDSAENIPPAIALEQRNYVVNSRSTVGTQTEILDYLRVLLSKLGKMRCLKDGAPVEKTTAQSVVEKIRTWLPGKKVLICAPLKIKNQSALQFVQQQGFQRIAVKRKKQFAVFKLDDIGTPDFPKLTKEKLSGDFLFLIVDRIKTKTFGPDELNRVLTAVETAFRVGQGKVIFHDIDSEESLEFERGFRCIECRAAYQELDPNMFSFNSPLGACSKCNGFGHTLDIDENLVVPDPNKTLKNSAIDPLSKPSYSEWEKDFFRFAERNGISIGKRYRELSSAQKKILWNGNQKDKTFPGILGFFEVLSRKKYKIHVRVFIRRYQTQTLCPLCNGSRVKPEANSVYLGGKNLAELVELNLSSLFEWLEKLDLSKGDRQVAAEAYHQIHRRLLFLNRVGVGYLTLSRLAKTLSGGEFQRINLATQLGNGLCGTLYVLDEPSIGLHSSDTQKLIEILKELRDLGNTLVVVEHDLEMMKAADWLVELGPGSGARGGEIISTGTLETFSNAKGSLTGKYLTGDFELFRKRSTRPRSQKKLILRGCREHTLKNIDVSFPLERFVVVTGVSGSGKSTLVHHTLFKALAKYFSVPVKDAETGRYESLVGAEQVDGVVLLDQKPIGKSSRSNPATYLKAWDEVRRTLANQVSAMRRGYLPSHFSFNVDGGRCPECKGEGEITLDMHFMADVRIPCEKCDGKRFKSEILDISYRGKNVHQILQMTVDEAYDIFRDNPVLTRKLGILRDVGLGYLQFGQPAPTLSGGESQRLKIASALDQRSTEKVLYIFDEPTTGLHQEDIRKLLDVIQDLVDQRQSVIMIEHHLDVITQADWIIDLGPGGGTAGGHITAEGTPDDVFKNEASITGQELRRAGYDFTRRGGETLSSLFS